MVTARKGQSTLEVLIAMAVLAVSFVAVLGVVFSGQSVALDSQQEDTAIFLARQSLETAISNAATDFSSLASSTATIDEFSLQTIVSALSTTTKQVLSRVSWQFEARSREVELATLVTDWKALITTGGDTGGGGTSGDWRNPRTLGTIDLGAGNQATGIDVVNKIVYLSATASSQNKPDFFVVNAANGASPFMHASLDTGPGLNAIDVAGTKAYVASESETAQLQIIDITLPSSPSVVSSLQLPGSGEEASTIHYSGGRVYIGTEQSSGPEFFVIDVSNPASPTSLGSYNVNADVNAIVVVGTTAYVANSGNTELLVLNVTNPAAISQVGSYNAAGTADGKSLFVSGTTLYLGRSSGSGEFLILDVTSSSPSLLATQAVGSDVNGIQQRDNLLFLATSDSNKEFQVWDIGNLASISMWSSFNFSQIGTGIDYEDNLVYMAVRSNDALRIITSGP